MAEGKPWWNTPALTIPPSFNFLYLRPLSTICRGNFKMENISPDSYSQLTFDMVVGEGLCKINRCPDFKLTMQVDFFNSPVSSNLDPKTLRCVSARMHMNTIKDGLMVKLVFWSMKHPSWPLIFYIFPINMGVWVCECVCYLTYQSIFPKRVSTISRAPYSIYSPRHWAGAGGPAVTIGADGASSRVRAAVPLIAGGPVSAAIGAVWSLSAAARHIPVGTGALLGHPPPGVAVISLLTIPTALWTLTASPSSGTGRKSRAGALPARATPTWRLALRAWLVALRGLAVAPVCSAPLGGAAAALPSAFSPLLPVFARLPWAAALLAARWWCGGSCATYTGCRLNLGGDHQLPAFRVTIWLGLVFRRGAWWGSPLLALSRTPFLTVFAVVFLVPTFPIPRVSNFVRVLGLFSGVPVPLALSTACFSVDIISVVVGWVIQSIPTPSLRRPWGRWVRERVRVGADIVVLHQRLHCVGTRWRRVAEGKIFGSRCRRGFPIMFDFKPFSFCRGRGHRRF